MHHIPVAILGASGYSGIELTYLLANHPRAKVVALASDRWAGEPVGNHLALDSSLSELKYLSPAETEQRAKDCAVALLATPNEVSMELAPRLLAAGCKVIDLSGAHRLTDAGLAKKYYKRSADAEGKISTGVYGLPELFRDDVVDAKMVANPGCFATAAALALAPLVREGLIERNDLIVNAISGVTGAGRKATEEYGFVAIDGDFRAYRVLSHQHEPEMTQTLAQYAEAPVSLVFTPHLAPIARGILATCYGRLTASASPADLTAVMARAYEDEPFVSVVRTPEDVSLKAVVGTNRCVLGVSCEPRAGGRVVVVAAIDNLVKGAAGQAVQNLNIVLGCEETAGLTQLRRFHA
jgi:N-acetyl-gamma-glutamyl-phosphate reductase